MDFNFTLKIIHGKEWIVTTFADKRYLCLEDILNAKTLSVEEIVKCIDAVLKKERETDELENERCAIDISENTVEIYDLFDHLLEEKELYPSISLETNKFKEFLLLWLKKKQEFIDEQSQIGDSSGIDG